MVVIMCLLSETSPICGNDCKVPTKTDRADSSLDKVSGSGQAQKMGQKSLKKRKPKRVLYPALVRKYLPRQEEDKAKKWLLILGAIVFFQIFIEDDGQCNHEVQTLSAHDSNVVKFLGHADTTVDSRPPLAGQGPKNVTMGNVTVLYFVTGSRGTLDSILSRSTYYDRRNDFA